MAKIINLQELLKKPSDKKVYQLKSEVTELEKQVPKILEKRLLKLLQKMETFRDETNEDPYHFFQQEMYELVDIYNRYGRENIEAEFPTILKPYLWDFEKFFGLRRNRF